ncbi:DUF4160 domain-containing protein [Acidilutibacter cellobiosedens]|jgi:hypothetical protein|uniref:DUF4160 domain-containing protein n=1 Tax=Acidilutibacter cellobiosedens TaxID=2507161 RepID=A0A410QH51_9FIRM|nr:DUF4160 domain-containing protein [Acidilutibacter cellobiosedens]MBE6081147.1 DUF4160 domain-containing protein [Tissierellaceae bacterium]QAT63174.1 DUF4160 domain-containing protein [Acidilutibacter cellobiosedens]
MPTISMFYGIIVRMYRELGGRHHVPHIHVLYCENEAIFDFDGNIIDGNIPRKQQQLTIAWILIHQEELKANWQLLLNGEEFFKIEPLR